MGRLTLEVEIGKPPNRCFALLTQRTGGAFDVCEPRPGGEWRAGYFNGSVATVVPPRELVLACDSGAPTAIVTIRVQRIGLKMTRVVLSIDAAMDDESVPDEPRHIETWRECLGRLKSLAETGAPNDSAARDAVVIVGADASRPQGPPTVDGGM